MDDKAGWTRPIKTADNKGHGPSRRIFGAGTFLLMIALALGLSETVSGAGASDGIVIVANSDAPGSVAIAQHYASVRGVPPANIISLRMPAAETITWKEFVGSLWQPVQDRLVKEGWIDAIAMDLVDDVGRRKYAISGHKISALILCRGVPLRIENDPALFKDVAGLTDHPELRTNQAAVDSELSLLAQTNSPINASLPNPLFNNPRPADLALAQVVKVCRLDGPTVADAMGLVDLAITAERSGLLGRAYVDIAGPHENGNRWLETTASKIFALGYDLTVAHGPQTMSAASRIDAPALYFGWYTPDLNGPFALPGFRFPPGAVAVHVHSYSAHTLRSTTEGWCGPLIARGATATVGNVYEPYLEFLHRPDLLMEALARGDDLVDAAYFALPVLSWQSIVIGDPLYRPFAKGLDAQTGNLAALPPPLAGYAVLRRMNLLDVAGKHPEAILLGKEAMKA
ncbi:MAG TPA: TIGR03790 family protein, partial [Opitutaceae bacterium]